jgi:hypothetical protein
MFSGIFNLLYAISLFFLLFLRYWVWTQGFTLAKQVLYCLSHVLRPFSSGYFGDRVSLFTQASLDYDLLFVAGWQANTTMSSFFLGAMNFDAREGLELQSSRSQPPM